MFTDPISDMLTRIRNAYLVGKESLVVDSSKLKTSILKILKENKYIKDFKQDGKVITIVLGYKDSKPLIERVERVSKPGRRVYVKCEDIPVVLSGKGVVILSTSKGILTGDEAKKNNLGGERIAKVY